MGTAFKIINLTLNLSVWINKKHADFDNDPFAEDAFEEPEEVEEDDELVDSEFELDGREKPVKKIDDHEKNAWDEME